MRNGFRKGKEDEHLKKVVEEGNMNEWEMDQILRQREASTINPKSIEYKIVLANDDLRKAKVQAHKNIEEKFHQLENLKLHIRRMKVEKESGEITSKLSDNQTMNADELSLQIQMEEHRMWVVSKEIIAELAYLRNIVGHFDAGKNLVMDRKEYEKYAEKVIGRLEKYGFSIFD